MRARAFLVATACLVVSSGAFAQKKPQPPAPPTSTPVIVSVQSAKKLKVQIAEGNTMPCDSFQNRMLFNSTMGSGESTLGNTEALCLCVRHTTDAFPQGGWSDSKMVCRPKTCKGKVCKPTPAAPLKVEIKGAPPR